jgi:sugar lactone lactonase YvrE
MNLELFMRSANRKAITSQPISSSLFSSSTRDRKRRLFARTGFVAGFRVLLMAALVATGLTLTAQSVTSFPGTVPVAGAPLTQTVNVVLTAGGTIDAAKVLTQGAPGLDYQVAGSDTCTGNTLSAGQQCSVSVSFLPLFPGARHGAVVLAQSDGTVLGTTFLEGNASGSVSVLVPGMIDTVAGNVNWTYSGDNGPATASAIFLPMGELTDAAGNLYIADTNNNRIRRVDAKTGIITTVAGGYVQGYAGDHGRGVDAALSSPTALAMDGPGNLYIADSGNLVIRMLSTVSGIITTVAGVGGPTGPAGDGGPAIAAHLTAVGGLALDGQHVLYLADTGASTIRRIDLGTGIITRFAGTGTAGYGGDNGQALSAAFSSPQGISFGADGSLYVADLSNNVIRRIAPGGVVTTVAGGGTNGLGDDGPALAAALTLPAAVAVDQAGNLYIADAGANRIRKVSATTGKISTIAGNGNEAFAGDGARADQSELYGPYSLYYDGQGNLFVGDMFHNRIREIAGSYANLGYDPIRVNRTSAPKLESMENDGNDDLLLALPALVNASLDPATTTCAFPATLVKGSSCVLGVAFSPTVLGDNVQGSVTLGSNAGDSPAFIQMAGQVLSVDPTAVMVTSSQNPSAFGTAVTFTAHVTTQGSSMTGTVQFLDGAVVMGSGPLSSSGATGTASFSTSSLTLGAHLITAVYSGDETNAASTSAALSQSVKQLTTLVLQSSANPSLQSATITLTATVAATGVMPTGQVVFSDGGTVLGSGTLNAGGVATLSIATLTIGQHALTASYAGDGNNGPSQSDTLQQVVNGQGSSVTVGTNRATVQVGMSVSFSAQVTGTSGPIPTGMVTFKDGATAIGTATLTDGVAGYTTAGLAPGPHQITAVYQGDALYGGSTSASLLETVQQLATVTVISSSANPSAAGAAVLLHATVIEASSNSPESAGGAITGTVTFLNGSTTLGIGTLSAGGLATISVATIPLGQNNITAVYSGSTNYLGSTAGVMVQSVVQAETSTALASSANPSTMEDAITLTATVTGQGGHPSGVVTFSSDGTVFGQAPLNGQGVATFAYSGLLVGRHGLVASYGGDAQNLQSVSPLLTQTVLLRPSAVVLTSSATSLTGGQQVTLIGVVQWTGTIVPTGMMTFQSTTGPLGTSLIDASGVATLTINPATGVTNVTATYSGDAAFAGSTSAAIPLTVGLPPQFFLKASQTTVAVQSLQHMTVDLTASSEKGFSDMLTLGCLGLPKAATCTFSQNRVSLPADGTFTVHVVVDTGSPLTAGSVASNEGPSSTTLIAICGLPGGVLGCLLFWKRSLWKARRQGMLGGVLILLVALGAAAGLSGCGTININGTPVGTYNFQITAAAQGTGVIQAVNMTLTVGK